MRERGGVLRVAPPDERPDDLAVDGAPRLPLLATPLLRVPMSRESDCFTEDLRPEEFADWAPDFAFGCRCCSLRDRIALGCGLRSWK